MICRYLLHFDKYQIRVYYIMVWHEKVTMELENYFEFHSEDDIRIKGTRIGITNQIYIYMYGGQQKMQNRIFITLTYLSRPFNS